MFRILATSGVITAASVVLYVRYLHQRYLSQVQHQAVDAAGRQAAYENNELETLPQELLDYPQMYRIVHDRDEKKLTGFHPLDHDNVEKLFTKLIRRNMTAFSHLPQSWMMSLLAKTPEQKESFKKSHLLTIDYQEGDLYCGFYRVMKRSPFKIEVNMEPPLDAGPLQGRLVVSLDQGSDGALLRTETLQWIEADSKMALPLERAPIRFMHEMASWWLLVSGATFLESLIAEEGKK